MCTYSYVSYSKPINWLAFFISRSINFELFMNKRTQQKVIRVQPIKSCIPLASAVLRSFQPLSHLQQKIHLLRSRPSSHRSPLTSPFTRALTTGQGWAKRECPAWMRGLVLLLSTANNTARCKHPVECGRPRSAAHIYLQHTRIAPRVTNHPLSHPNHRRGSTWTLWRTTRPAKAHLKARPWLCTLFRRYHRQCQCPLPQHRRGVPLVVRILFERSFGSSRNSAGGSNVYSCKPFHCACINHCLYPNFFRLVYFTYKSLQTKISECMERSNDFFLLSSSSISSYMDSAGQALTVSNSLCLALW